jgi:MFS family permease
LRAGLETIRYDLSLFERPFDDGTSLTRMSAQRPAAVPDPEVLRARRLLLGLYLLLGLTVSSWLSRLPSIRASLDLTTAQLGTVLLMGAVGSLITVLGAGAFVTRWGSRVTLLSAAGLYSVATILMGVGPAVGSVAVLVLGIVVMSASFGLGNVPLNVETVVIERRIGRTIVPQFHAAFSIGSVIGSLIGAAASWAGVPVVVQFTALSLVTLVWRIKAVPGSVLAPLPGATPSFADGVVPAAPSGRGLALRQSLGAWRERRTLLIGLVVMAAALSEGSANNWLAIAVVDGFGEPEAVAALVFGVFVASMTAVRLAGTWLIDRFGRVAVLIGSGTTSVVGLLLFGLAPGLPGAVVGAMCWGLGAGLAVPIGMAAVSTDPLRAAGRVAVVSAFASMASITAPPLIGIAAHALGARHALLFVTVIMLVGIAVSRSVREPAPEGLTVDLPVDDRPVLATLGTASRGDVVESEVRR